MNNAVEMQIYIFQQVFFKNGNSGLPEYEENSLTDRQLNNGNVR